MARKRILLACPNYWHSPFQVGSQHLARRFVRAGWEAAYISDPISPWHLARGLTRDLQERFAIYRDGGRDDLNGRLWTYLPAAFLTPHGKPILRSALVHRHWQRWTCPNVVDKIKQQGFGSVDLLYIDSVHQSFWLDVLDYRHAVYRVADYNPQYEKYTAATHTLEKEIARRVDLVLYPSQQLQGYVEALGARRSLILPNGVDYEHFAGVTHGASSPLPPEYRAMPRPIAIYLGVMPDWFHFEWVREAACCLPEMSFVLIGPDRLARRALGGLANVHVLGCRDYATVPAYLQHADVGLMPFDVRCNRRAVEALNPQKLYAYLASGLPVVSSEWEAIQELRSPARLCSTVEQFVDALRRAVEDRGNSEAYRRYAAQFDWRNQMNALLAALETDTAHGPPSVGLSQFV